eukprot:m.85782 g.85782  ORF g.85782 m.85782 type:complete len:53 (-) comp13023_c0_seq3:737-895(-)
MMPHVQVLGYFQVTKFKAYACHSTYPPLIPSIRATLSKASPGASSRPDPSKW